MSQHHTIWGYVSEDGNRLSGDGFVVSKRGTGRYDVVFEPPEPFSGIPAVVCTAKSGEGNARFMDLTEISNGGFSVEIVSQNNNTSSRDWTFIATGDLS